MYFWSPKVYFLGLVKSSLFDIFGVALLLNMTLKKLDIATVINVRIVFTLFKFSLKISVFCLFSKTAFVSGASNKITCNKKMNKLFKRFILSRYKKKRGSISIPMIIVLCHLFKSMYQFYFCNLFILFSLFFLSV